MKQSNRENYGIKLLYKTVRNDGITWRRVYYNPQTKRQIAVLTSQLSEPDPDEPWEWMPIRVCFPHEHAGWAYYSQSVLNAERAVARHCFWWGKILNVFAAASRGIMMRHL